MKNQVAALEKSLPTNLRSFLIPITAAYCQNHQRKKKPLCEEEGVAYIEHHLVEKLQDIAAKHKGDNAKVDLASQGRKINSRLILDIGMFIQIIQGIITSSMDGMGVYIWSFLGHSGDRKTTGKRKKERKRKNKG
jgi:hypothetical protein